MLPGVNEGSGSRREVGEAVDGRGAGSVSVLIFYVVLQGVTMGKPVTGEWDFCIISWTCM